MRTRALARTAIYATHAAQSRSKISMRRNRVIPPGLIDPSIKRSRASLRAISLSLGVLAVTAASQAAIYLATGSVALLADLVHNFGDALTAVPLA